MYFKAYFVILGLRLIIPVLEIMAKHRGSMYNKDKVGGGGIIYNPETWMLTPGFEPQNQRVRASFKAQYFAQPAIIIIITIIQEEIHCGAAWQHDASEMQIKDTFKVKLLHQQTSQTSLSVALFYWALFLCLQSIEPSNGMIDIHSAPLPLSVVDYICFD